MKYKTKTWVTMNSFRSVSIINFSIHVSPRTIAMPSSITIENEDVEPLNASFVLFKIYLLVLGLWFSIGFSKGIMKLLSVDPESLPPGPRGLPLIGNELQIPRDKQWLCFDKWRKQYGNSESYHFFFPFI